MDGVSGKHSKNQKYIVKDLTGLQKGGINTTYIVEFYKVVVQLILLHGMDTWVMMGMVLGAFDQMHQGAACSIWWRREKIYRLMGEWLHPLIEEYLTVVVLLSLK